MIGRHKFSSGIADSADPALILASDWNADVLLGFAMTNRTGGQLAAGDVVALDSANNKSVVLADTKSAKRQYAVLVSAVPSSSAHIPGTTVENLETGIFAPQGILKVRVAGAVTRGNYLRKSATAKALEDTSAAVGNARPDDAIAVALDSAGGAGTIDAAFLGIPAAGGTLTQTFRGLHLRTHPDNDVAASKVMLVHADEIVMDTGERVPDWDNLVADITVAGAGGLDTGSELASTWYEVHAIRKSSDGTKNLLLHRAKDYFKDEEQTTDATANALRRSTSTTRLAQGFQVDTAGKVEFVDLKVQKTGSPTGNVWVEIQSDSSGSPSGTVLATSDKMDVARFSATAGFVRFIFRNPATLSATPTQHHLVLQGDYTIATADHLDWRSTNTDAYASRGEIKRFDGASWLNTDVASEFDGNPGDAVFKIYVTRNDTAVTMPAGYDQKCKLAPGFFNNSGSNFDPLVYNDRKARPVKPTVSSSVSVVAATLTDWSTALPPGRLWLIHGIRSTGAGNHHSFAGPVPDGFGMTVSAGSTTDWDGGGSRAWHDAAPSNSAFGPVLTEMQAAYLGVDASTSVFYVIAWEW